MPDKFYYLMYKPYYIDNFVCELLLLRFFKSIYKNHRSSILIGLWCIILTLILPAIIYLVGWYFIDSIKYTKSTTDLYLEYTKILPALLPVFITAIVASHQVKQYYDKKENDQFTNLTAQASSETPAEKANGITSLPLLVHRVNSTVWWITNLELAIKYNELIKEEPKRALQIDIGLDFVLHLDLDLGLSLHELVIKNTELIKKYVKNVKSNYNEHYYTYREIFHQNYYEVFPYSKTAINIIFNSITKSLEACKQKKIPSLIEKIAAKSLSNINLVTMVPITKLRIPLLRPDQSKVIDKISAVYVEKRKIIDVNLPNLDLSGATIRESDFVLTDLSHAKFNYTDFTKTNFIFSVLTDVELKNAKLKGVNFNKVDLFCANLTGANISSTKFIESNLCKINFKDVIINKETDFTNSIIDKKTFIKLKKIFSLNKVSFPYEFHLFTNKEDLFKNFTFYPPSDDEIGRLEKSFYFNNKEVSLKIPSGVIRIDTKFKEKFDLFDESVVNKTANFNRLVRVLLELEKFYERWNDCLINLDTENTYKNGSPKKEKDNTAKDNNGNSNKNADKDSIICQISCQIYCPIQKKDLIHNSVVDKYSIIDVYNHLAMIYDFFISNNNNAKWYYTKAIDRIKKKIDEINALNIKECEKEGQRKACLNQSVILNLIY